MQRLMITDDSSYHRFKGAGEGGVLKGLNDEKTQLSCLYE